MKGEGRRGRERRGVGGQERREEGRTENIQREREVRNVSLWFIFLSLCTVLGRFSNIIFFFFFARLTRPVRLTVMNSECIFLRK
jgi:hypothetical protein